jgi:hypothetical protein
VTTKSPGAEAPDLASLLPQDTPEWQAFELLDRLAERFLMLYPDGDPDLFAEGLYAEPDTKPAARGPTRADFALRWAYIECVGAINAYRKALAAQIPRLRMALLANALAGVARAEYYSGLLSGWMGEEDVIAGAISRAQERAAHARHAQSPKGKAKLHVYQRWQSLSSEERQRYGRRAAFARDMVQEFPVLESTKVIEGWWTDWGRGKNLPTIVPAD